MARLATETAEILAALYDESFCGEESERYRISWHELREIAGVKRLADDYLNRVSEALLETGCLFIVCDNYFVVAGESDFSRDRRIPQRLVEKYLYDENEEDNSDDDELEDDEIEDEDDLS